MRFSKSSQSGYATIKMVYQVDAGMHEKNTHIATRKSCAYDSTENVLFSIVNMRVLVVTKVLYMSLYLSTGQYAFH